MLDKDGHKERKRIIVEEVVEKREKKPEPEILPEALKDETKSEPETESIVSSFDAEPNRETVEVNPRKSPSIALWIIIPGIFLLGAILGGIVFYQRGVNNGNDIDTTPTSSPTSSTVPTSSPSGTVDLTKYTVVIYNGSGIAGEAAKVKTLLTTAGFKVGTTGNASTYDYTKTIIKVKSTVESSYVSALSVTLGKTYVVDTAQTLDSTSADSVQVIVGTSKAQ